MKYLYQVLFLSFYASFLFTSCSSENSSSNGKEENHQHSAEVSTDCGNCGMPSQDYPKWKVKSYFGEEMKYFCSPKCFFLYQHKQQVADSAWVMDFYEVQSIPAKTAFYILGSDVLGPMGKDFVPVSTKEAAEEFTKDHHGEALQTFDETLEKLRGEN